MDYPDLHIKLLNKRFHNWKPLMKFYIGKDLYDLVDYAVYFKNSWDIEFFTLNEDYKEIWSKLRVREDYGRTRLRGFEWDKNYSCYSVDVFCPDLINFIISWNFHHWHSVGENIWKDHARHKGWIDEEELHQGWLVYKAKVDNWFKLNYSHW